MDVMLFIYPWDKDLTKITDELNKIELTMGLTYELKTNIAYSAGAVDYIDSTSAEE